jgi:hypothetical protein
LTLHISISSRDLKHRTEAHAKTRNGKLSGMKNGTFIHILGYVNHLDAITHVGIGIIQ